MEIDITSFVTDEEPFDYSASITERGKNAGTETWSNAIVQAQHHPLLTTPEQLDALREHVKGFGAWDDEEIDAWDATHCNALFIQLISGDMREAGMDECDREDFDWEDYEARASASKISGNIYRGDDAHIYYYLGS